MLHQFPSPALFFPEQSQLSFPFSSSFFLSQGVPLLLCLSPASESLCPSIMIVGLGFAKLFRVLSPSFAPPFLTHSTLLFSYN